RTAVGERGVDVARDRTGLGGLIDVPDARARERRGTGAAARPRGDVGEPRVAVVRRVNAPARRRVVDQVLLPRRRVRRRRTSVDREYERIRTAFTGKQDDVVF